MLCKKTTPQVWFNFAIIELNRMFSNGNYLSEVNLMNLTTKDVELARRYIICRAAIKGFTRDKQKIT
jgi:hypothetical protein